MPTIKADTAPFDPQMVRELADILNDTGLTEIEIEREGIRIRVAKTAAAATFLTQPAPSAAGATVAPIAVAPTPEAPRAGDVVTSPMVGTVYLQPQPGAPAFARVGDSVVAG